MPFYVYNLLLALASLMYPYLLILLGLQQFNLIFFLSFVVLG